MTGPGRTEVSIDEATSAMAAPKATDLTTKLEGANVPEQFRGKTLEEVARFASTATEALRISEDARKTAEARSYAPAPVVVQAAPAAVVAEREPTDEELAEAFEKNPVAAVRWMTNKARADAEKNLESRLGPLGASAMANAEIGARGRFTTEFAVLADEIKTVTDEIKKNGGGQNVLGTPAGWDQVMSYVRGKPGNFEKVIAANAKAAGEKAALEAREVQSRSGGYSPTPTRSSSEVAPGDVRPISGGAGLDETQRKIADMFIAQGTFKDYAEYAKWDKMGGQ